MFEQSGVNKPSCQPGKNQVENAAGQYDRYDSADYLWQSVTRSESRKEN